MGKLLDLVLEIIGNLKTSGDKPWYLSKTLWINVIALSALLIQSQYGFVISPEEQLGIITVANLILRAITGKELKL